MTTPEQAVYVYVTDEDGNIVFTQSGDGDKCPVCNHTADQHGWDGCGADSGDYDHINGFATCGCPLNAASAVPARGES